MSCQEHAHNSAPSTFDMPDIVVNGKQISHEDIAREMQYHPAEDQEKACRQAAEALVIQTLLLQKAQEMDLGSAADPQQDEAQDEALIRVLIEREASSPLATDEDCRRYFEANQSRFNSPDLLEAKHILLAADPSDEQQREEAREQVTLLLAELKNDISLFGSYAKKYSACPSKETDGHLGQISKGQTVPEFEQQVFRLEEGLADNPVESRYGFHLVVVDRKISGQPLEYDHVSDRIRQYLNEASQRKAISQLIHVLISDADISGIELDIADSPLLQ